MDKITNLIDQLLDLPKMVNEKLPSNNFNAMMDSSEGSIAGWTGTFYKYGAFVVLVGALYAVITGGIEGMGAAEGIGKAGAVLGMLVMVYAAFPITQVIRSAGDSLGSSKSGIVDFVFKDVVVANITVVGHVAALVALFTAINATIGWAIGADMGSAVSANLIEAVNYAYALPIDATAAFMGMIGLEFVGNVLNDWNAWSVVQDVTPQSLGGLVSVGWGYVEVALVLAQLYVALALYHFFWGILNTLFNWIKSPSLPFKSS